MASFKSTLLTLLAFCILLAIGHPTTAPPQGVLVTKTLIYTFSITRFGPQVGPMFAIWVDETTTGTVTRLDPQPTTFPATITVEATTSETISQVVRLMGSTGPGYTSAWTRVWSDRTTSVVAAPEPTME